MSKDKKEHFIIDGESVSSYLGVHRYEYGVKEEESSVGLVTGLAWTEVGGNSSLSKQPYYPVMANLR